MPKPDTMDRRMVKNVGDFHPATENLRHHKGQPSASTLPFLDDEQDSLAALEALSIEELRERAKILAIDGWETLSHGDLVRTLRDYWQRELESRGQQH